MPHLLLTGFLSILAQVLLLRELAVALYGVELIYLLGVAAWLLWSALGVATSRRVAHPAPPRICGLFLLAAVLVPLDVAFIRASRIVFQGVPGAYLALAEQAAVVAIALFFPAWLLGLVFQWAARLYVGQGRTLAAAYAVECVGSLGGGLASTLLSRLGVGNLAGVFLASAATAAAAWAGLRAAGARKGAGAAGCVFAAAIAGLWTSPSLDRRMTAWNHPDLIATRDSPYGRVTVTGREGQVAVFENDALSFETEGTDAEEFVHLAALQHPTPRDVLALGGGIEGILREVLQHRPGRVDYVELNPVLLDLVVPRLSPEVVASFAAFGVRVIQTDPRSFLRTAGAYDLILIGMPEPTSGQSNRFYTREFFQMCAAHLRPGGVVAFRLAAAENFWTPQLLARLASVRAALATSFRQVQVLPGSASLFVASDAALTEEPEVLARRWEERGIEARLVGPAYIRFLYTNDRFSGLAEALDRTAAPVNSDQHPIVYHFSSLIWLAKFLPRLASSEWVARLREPAVQGGLLGALAISGLLAAALARRSPRLRWVMLAFLSGGAGMLVETLLVLRYQTTRGVLYQDLGVLLTSFMAGMAASAAALDRHARGWLPEADAGRPARRWGLGLAGGLAAAALFCVAPAGAFAGSGLAGIAAWLFVGGFCAAGLFACASLQDRRGPAAAVSSLYAADLVGGCAAAVGSSLFLVPLLGLSATAGCGLLLVLAVVALVL